MILTSHALGAVAVPVLAVLWLAVQRAWQRTFADGAGSPAAPGGGDPMASRGGCRGCDEAKDCERRREAAGASAEERTT